jgi:hypothetical protein
MVSILLCGKFMFPLPLVYNTSSTYAIELFSGLARSPLSIPLPPPCKHSLQGGGLP